MTRRTRYTEAQLTPITRETSATYRVVDEPRAGTRAECWRAHSVDGRWTYLRTEETGSPWTLVHLATGYAVAAAYSTLDDARYATAGGTAWLTLWDDADWQLAEWPDLPETAGAAVTTHDHARALMTWLVDAGHAPASRLVRVASTR